MSGYRKPYPLPSVSLAGVSKWGSSCTSSNDWRNKLVKLSGGIGAAIALKRDGGTACKNPTSSPKTLGLLSSTPQFRMELDKLARLPASPHSNTTGALSILTEEGIAQIDVNLLPLFQHLIIKRRKRGVVVVMGISRQTKWTSERNNIHRQYISYRAEVEAGVSSFCSISPQITSLQNRLPA